VHRRRLVAAITSLVTLAVIGTATGAGPQLTKPTDTQQQVEATMPIAVPSTPSCTETVMTHDFANSYGAPFNGTYSPPVDCPGPWAKVVLTLTSTVAGTQFDRDVYVAIGHAAVLDGTTSEPCCTGNATTWTVHRDLTAVTPLLTTDQPVQVELDNVTDSTDTGVYHTIVSLTFYEATSSTPEGHHPTVVLPISSNGSGGPMLTIGHDGDTVGAPVTFPTDLSRLSAEVFADAHGPCEEFWWDDPGDCAGTPYREIGIYIDGRLAGAAPAYPVIYTGALGPGLWEPIPSPRAWNIKPYDLDLTPFVGMLTDGQPHGVSLGVFDSALQSGDFWQLAANLQGWIDDPGVPTVGRLLGTKGDAAPTQDATDPTGQGAPYLDAATHSLTFTGEATVAGQLVRTTVSESMSETAKQAVVIDAASWSWNASTTTERRDHATVESRSATWGLTTDLATTYDLTEAGSTTTRLDGTRNAWTSYSESMTTDDATGIAFNGAEHESYGYADDAGTCYDHQLASQAGELTVDQVDSTLCPSAPA
jgi:hypothetical protein